MPPARTQQERRIETRLKLLEATVESLVESGLAATTSRRVSELAGVSLGAQTYHFPRRSELLGAAAEHLVERRIAEIREISRSRIPDDTRDRLHLLLDLFWGELRGPAFTVLVKLWIAADDDPELYARLLPVERRLAETRASLPAMIHLPEDPQWRQRAELAFASLRGLAFSERFEPQATKDENRWPRLRETLIGFLLPPR